MRVLGVDPGTRQTGFGVLDFTGNRIEFIKAGTLRLEPKSHAKVPLEQRLATLYEGLVSVIEQLKPQVIVVERIFHAKNALSSLKLGHARGVVLLICAQQALELCEVSATEVKEAVVGHGRADKEQVAKMLDLILGFQKYPTPDASDATALAVCYAQRFRAQKMGLGTRPSRRSGSVADALRFRVDEVLKD